MKSNVLINLKDLREAAQGFMRSAQAAAAKSEVSPEEVSRWVLKLRNVIGSSTILEAHLNQLSKEEWKALEDGELPKKEAKRTALPVAEPVEEAPKRRRTSEPGTSTLRSGSSAAVPSDEIRSRSASLPPIQ